MTLDEFKKSTCYITQDDRLQLLLTVYENMKIAADLKLGNSVSVIEKSSRVRMHTTLIKIIIIIILIWVFKKMNDEFHDIYMTCIVMNVNIFPFHISKMKKEEKKILTLNTIFIPTLKCLLCIIDVILIRKFQERDERNNWFFVHLPMLMNVLFYGRILFCHKSSPLFCWFISKMFLTVFKCSLAVHFGQLSQFSTK